MSNTSFKDCYPVFIVGAGRSGTTLLQLMLNAHPKLAIMGELHYFDQILEIKNKVPTLRGHEAIDTFFTLMRAYSGIKAMPNIEHILRAVKLRMYNDNNCSYEKFYKYVLEEFAKTRKAERFGEKTPTNIRFMEQIFNIFPNSKIIHIIRDPRDVISSSIKMHWIANDIIVNALKWKCEIFYSEKFRMRKESYLEINYEKLVCDTETQLRKICAFLGEEYKNMMIEYYKTSTDFVKIKAEPHKSMTCNPVNNSAIGRWKRDMNKGQIFIIENIVGSLMARFGYKKTKINIMTKVIAPVVLFLELLKYVKYKKNEKRVLEQKYPNTSFGHTPGYNKYFLKSLFKYKP